MSVCVMAVSTNQCTIAGTTSTVVASVTKVSDGMVTVTISNDGDKSVNVFIGIQYSNNCINEISKLLHAYSEVEVQIPCPAVKKDTSISMIHIITLKGNTCK